MRSWCVSEESFGRVCRRGEHQKAYVSEPKLLAEPTYARIQKVTCCKTIQKQVAENEAYDEEVIVGYVVVK